MSCQPTACEAVIRTKEQEIPAQDFFLCMFETSLGDRKLITSFSLEAPDAAYAKFPHPAFPRTTLINVNVGSKGATMFNLTAVRSVRSCKANVPDSKVI